MGFWFATTVRFEIGQPCLHSDVKISIFYLILFKLRLFNEHTVAQLVSTLTTSSTDPGSNLTQGACFSQNQYLSLSLV